jgi:hypothetical protein
MIGLVYCANKYESNRGYRSYSSCLVVVRCDHRLWRHEEPWPLHGSNSVGKDRSYWNFQGIGSEIECLKGDLTRLVWLLTSAGLEGQYLLYFYREQELLLLLISRTSFHKCIRSTVAYDILSVRGQLLRQCPTCLELPSLRLFLLYHQAEFWTCLFNLSITQDLGGSGKTPREKKPERTA